MIFKQLILSRYAQMSIEKTVEWGDRGITGRGKRRRRYQWVGIITMTTTSNRENRWWQYLNLEDDDDDINEDEDIDDDDDSWGLTPPYSHELWAGKERAVA